MSIAKEFHDIFVSHKTTIVSGKTSWILAYFSPDKEHNKSLLPRMFNVGVTQALFMMLSSTIVSIIKYLLVNFIVRFLCWTQLWNSFFHSQLFIMKMLINMKIILQKNLELWPKCVSKPFRLVRLWKSS